MGRKPGSKNKKRTSLNVYIEDHPFLKTVDDYTKCLVCKSEILTKGRDGKKRIRAHELTTYHLDNFKLLLSRHEQSTVKLTSDEIHKEITRYFVGVNMPLSILDNQSSKVFFKKAFGFTIRCAETYRCSLMPTIIVEERQRIEDEFKTRPFMIKLDETTDANGRYILNVMGQPLKSTPTEHYPTDTIELEKCNSASILIVLRFILPRVVRSREDMSSFKGIVTDGAAYCRKLGVLLKEEHPEIHHVICIAHNLHLVAEEVGKKNAILNNLYQR